MDHVLLGSRDRASKAYCSRPTDRPIAGYDVSMENAETHGTTFLFSSLAGKPDRFFQGYCFVGSDYVFGQAGADAMFASTGRRVSSGMDGCYAVAESSGDDLLFGNDFAGYKVLYYYHDGEYWAVSNSYALVVDDLRSAGLATTPNYSQLSAVSGPGSAHSQLYSFETMTRGVKVVPRAHLLVITPHGARLEPMSYTASTDYEGGLSRHIETWLSRYETLMKDPSVDFAIDVTGGVDSRTNLALVVRAKGRLGGAGSQPRLNCGSTPSNTADLDVAESLTARFGLDLNDSRRFPARSLTAEEGFETFRNLNAGVYFPIYFPVEGPMPGKISIGGGGGEIHRRFYENHQRSKSVKKFLESYSSTLSHPWLGPEFEANGKRAMELAAKDGSDPLRIHYREFRHRFHVGRSPRYGVTFTPLDSVSADVAQSQAGPDRLDEGQFNYDIMASLNPELLDMPFDVPRKAPSESVRARLVAVSTSAQSNPGRVWAPRPEVRVVKRSSLERASMLARATEVGAKNRFVQEFWGESMIAEAQSLIASLLEGRNIGNAVNLKPVSAVLAADLVFGGDGGLAAATS